MIGFLLVLTTGTLNLVLQEMQDGKGKQDYLKASAAAEGSLELALLQNKDPRISYSFEGRVQTHTGKIDAFETEMIPLFAIKAV